MKAVSSTDVIVKKNKKVKTAFDITRSNYSYRGLA